MNLRKLFFYSCLLFLFPILYQCSNGTQKNNPTTEIIDIENRKITIPEQIQRIVGLNAGAMRYISYMGGVPMVVGVEDKEVSATRPYNLAFPEIKQKAIIGPQPGGDEELILKANPEVIFWAGYATAKSSAQALQNKIGIPVITLKSGELGVENQEIFQSLRIIGKTLKKEQRAENLILYINKNIEELYLRTQNIDENQKPSVYVGGLSFNGSRGITSTRVNFAPFDFVNAKNIVKTLGYNNTYTQPINIDVEQIVKWNPDYIFIDANGWKIAQEEIKKNPDIYQHLKAFENKNVYIIPRYINNSTNFDYAFIAAWYIGKTLYPDLFQDINIEDKAIEILSNFFDKPIDLKDFDVTYGKAQM